MAEQMSPEDLARFLTEFRSRTVRSIFACHGTVDKFLGDGVLAVFGALGTVEKPARSALRCIEDILAATDAWSREREAGGQAPARITIGGHFGEAFVGILGTDDMLEFTAIGDTVNVAQRLQRVAADSGWKVVVSEELRAAAGVPFAADQWSEITEQAVIGRSRPLHVWVGEAQAVSAPKVTRVRRIGRPSSSALDG
jgi:adenylate cyclase